MINEDENLKKYAYKLRKYTTKKYSLIDKIYCPALKENIFFSSIGLRHLRYKPDGTSRNLREIIYKMKLFPCVVGVVMKSKKITGVRKTHIQYSRGNLYKKKPATTYSIVDTVKDVSIRVILIRIGNGRCRFYSVMKDK